MNRAFKDFFGNPRTKIVAQFIGVISSFALLTAFIYIFRAGMSGGHNWPALQLSASDSQVLFHLADDIISGAKLDWVFSPQVYLFPEMLISFFSYFLTQGNMALYLLLVAVINNVLLFIAIIALARFLFPKVSLLETLKRASLASLPLLIFPLFGSHFLFYAHLLPTFYYGVYLTLLLTPILMLARNKWLVGIIGAMYLLATASNPMVMIVTIPSVVVMVLLKYFQTGTVKVTPALRVVAFAVAGMITRQIFLSPLAGASSTSYISPARFTTTITNTYHEILNILLNNNLDRYLFLIVVIVALISLVALLRSVRRFFASGSERRADYLITWLLMVPCLTILTFYLLMAPALQYLWVIFVGNSVILLLTAIRHPRRLGFAGFAGIALLLALPMTATVALNSRTSYFNPTNAYAACLAKNVARQTGVAEYAYARPYTLQTKGVFKIAQIDPNLNFFPWLTNKTLFYANPITFVYVEGGPATSYLSESVIVAHFGTPSKIVHCSENSIIYLFPYDLRGKFGYSF